jgi:hypothetical protein
MAAKPFAPFTAKEHATFVSALEKNGESPTVETWTRIAEVCATKCPNGRLSGLEFGP